eukprot:270057_1
MSTWTFNNTEQAYFTGTKNAERATRSIVFGFIRSIEALFKLQTNTPIDIALMCLMYYYNPEHFTEHGPHMTLHDYDQTVEHDGKPYEHTTTYNPMLSYDKCYDDANTVYG